MLKYKGGGFIPGVPARDLRDEEVLKFGKEDLLKSGLYEEVVKEIKKKVVEEDNYGGHQSLS